jgi:putative iron-regulated protein
MQRTLRTLASLAALGLLPACGDDGDVAATSDTTAAMTSARETYTHVVTASYADTLEVAQALEGSIGDFLDEPSEDGLNAARDAWRASREPYLETEVFRFYDGPIDNAEDGPEGFLNAWPMDEAYVDYVVDGDQILHHGIVNDPEIELTGDELEGLNEGGGEKNISTGYHALEFLLWGQDLDENGPGARPYTDYVEGDDGTAENQDRRGEYLRTASSLLVGHLEDLVDAWAEGDDSNYRAEFAGVTPKEAFTRILTGMVVLSGFETGGERIQTALDSGDQEDEHSCFSDNTTRDMVQDIQGIKNVWVGSYEGLDGSVVSGPGMREVVMARSKLAAPLTKSGPELAAELDAKIDESLALAKALKAPFDREISFENPEGRVRVEALATSLREQSDLLEDVFRGFELTVPEPK